MTGPQAGGWLTAPAAVTGFPLSPLQRRLWRLQSLAGAPSYGSGCEVEIRGPLDPALLCQAWREAVARHEILRTRFVVVPGMPWPLQVVEPAAEIPMQLCDLRGLDPERQQARLAQLRARLREPPFAPAAGPLVRIALVTTATAEHRLLLAASALCTDAEGTVRMIEELGRAAAAGPPGADPPVQYADAAQWMNEAVAGEQTAVGRQRWRHLDFSGELEVSFPGETAGRGEAYLAATREARLPEATQGAVRALARSRGMPVALVVQGCWRVLLGRLLGRESLVVATACDGRNYAELQGAVGLFSRYVPVRCRAVEALSFVDLLERVRDATAEAADWQESFAWDEELAAPAFADLAFSAAALTRWESGRLAFRVARLEALLDRSALELQCVDAGHALALRWRYDASRLPVGEVELLGERLAAMLAETAARPLRRVGDLELLSPGERQLLLVERNQTVAPLPGLPVHTRFGEVARRRAGEVAVVASGETLTFGELDRRSSQLAWSLLARGAGPEVRVGVLLERSCALAVGLLGVLKTGGCYVPVDPSYPAERAALILRDAGCALLLTREPFRDRFAGELPPLLLLDRDAAAIAAEPADAPHGLPDPANLAYVIYTSGSTGQPKGVMVTHRGLENYLLWCLEAYPLAPGSGAPLHSPLGFDLSVTSLFAPWLAGAAVAMVPEGPGIDGLAAVLGAGGRFGLVKLTPAHLELLSQGLPDAAAGASRSLVVGGEQLLAEGLAWWRERAPETVVFNEYGPTEAVVGCCVHRTVAGALAAGAVPIGRPIRNTRLYVVDAALHPVPQGVAGELLIGGAGVARGYSGRGDLTAERFVPDAFGAVPGGRLYRTGDLVRGGADGNLRYLGRTDHQVKIRGYRIEPGEIEVVLAQHPLVREATVVARPAAGGPVLAAYLVPEPRWGGITQRLRDIEDEGLAAGRAVWDLPNGLKVFHRNRGETEYLYKELFEDAAYLRHGIDLAPGACVFDVGANIGMFSLFVTTQVAGAKIFAFEPIPQLCADLRLNVRLHGMDVRVFGHGVADGERTATFSYFPHLTLISGRFADGGEERDLVRRFELQRRNAADDESRDLLDQLLAERLTAERCDCRLRPLSAVIADERVERIDLLKIDVEKSELEVLAGIDDGDWAKIRQLVVEVHDGDGRVAQVDRLLRGRGFELTVDQERSLLGSDLFVVYARRPEVPAAGARTTPTPMRSLAADPRQLIDELRSLLARRLPEHMIPASLTLLPELPLTVHGKVDRQALAAREVESPPAAAAPSPRTPLEQVLAALWSEVLGRGEIGRGESFFDLGGHSLLVMRVISRLRTAFGVEISVREFFADPTLAGLAAAVEEALAAGAHPRLPPIERVPRAGALPLSLGQQRLWFLDQLHPGGVSYNLGRAVRLSGPLAVAVLERSIGEAIRRHEVLRTTFAAGEDGPRQVIAPPRPFTLPVVDLASCPAAGEAAAWRLAEAATLRPFDLARGPLLRLWLVRLAPAEHVLVMILHHIVSDGGLMGVLARELSALYAAFSAGRPSPLPELPVQYADYAVWQRRWLSDELLDMQLAYWRSQLANPPLALLPTDRPRPAAMTGRGATEELALPPELARQLRQLARAQQVTVFMTILAALDVLLHHLSGGREDILVGANVAGRDRAEVEGLIGFFVNQIVLRTDLAGNPTFGELLARVRQVTVAAYAHQDVPFERVVQALQPDREPGASPLFQVKLEMQSAAPPDLAPASGVTMSPLELEQPFAHFDLSLAVEDSPDKITASFIYSTELFEAVTAQRMLRRFEGLLHRAAGDPAARLATLRDWLAREDERELAGAATVLTELGAQKLRSARRRHAGAAGSGG